MFPYLIIGDGNMSHLVSMLLARFLHWKMILFLFVTEKLPFSLCNYRTWRLCAHTFTH